jgi:hypothetical protein
MGSERYGDVGAGNTGCGQDRVIYHTDPRSSRIIPDDRPSFRHSFFAFSSCLLLDASAFIGGQARHSLGRFMYQYREYCIVQYPLYNRYEGVPAFMYVIIQY